MVKMFSKLKLNGAEKTSKVEKMSIVVNKLMNTTQCPSGILIPALQTTPRNAVLYLAALLYCFLGIAIAADIFMCSIEKITSATRKVKKPREGKKLVPSEYEDEYVEVTVWNPTVANLTLMALGSSAPEILLSIIEIAGNNFKAGELGPGTIVGSAAFNLFCISAICVAAVKSPQGKRIAAFKVFLVTAFFGTFAYIWLYLILSVFTPNFVTVVEAGLTLFYFVLLVGIAYVVDIQIWKKQKPTKDLTDELEMQDTRKGKGAISEKSLDVNIRRYASQTSLQPDGRITSPLPPPSGDDLRALARDVARVYPSLSADDQAKILAYRLNKSQPHSRLYYRIRAVREMTSSWRRSSEEREMESLLASAGVQETDGRRKPVVEFSARVYAIDKADQVVILTIVRRGPCQHTLTVSYHTVNGIAKKNLHYLPKHETIQLTPGQRERDIQIQLVEGADWRPNHVFYVHLKIQDQEDEDKTKLGKCAVARVRFPDETTSFMGESSFEFVKSNYVTSESCGWVRTFVTKRGKNLRKPCNVIYETDDGTAQASFDYVPVKKGKLSFTGNEHEKYIDIEVLDDKQDEKDETFNIELLETSDPQFLIGNRKRTTVTIISDDNVLKNITNVRKLMGYYMKKLTPGQDTWIEQIVNASTVNGGDVVNASVTDCILHAIAFPWKFALAFVPPPSILGGWLCFVVALAVIGLITAVVGDLASIFGCMVDLSASVTAITLVALGTSLPDTFASKIAAENDDNADNAVGNITGSNSVNVFLGLGLPWLLASIYWYSQGLDFEVQAGNLGFSVGVFTVFSALFLVILFLRRLLALFGNAELGGPFVTKILSALFFVLLWIGYVSLSIWKSQ